jgi:hypothetical protein
MFLPQHTFTIIELYIMQFIDFISTRNSHYKSTWLHGCFENPNKPGPGSRLADTLPLSDYLSAFVLVYALCSISMAFCLCSVPVIQHQRRNNPDWRDHSATGGQWPNSDFRIRYWNWKLER